MRWDQEEYHLDKLIIVTLQTSGQAPIKVPQAVKPSSAEHPTLLLSQLGQKVRRVLVRAVAAITPITQL